MTTRRGVAVDTNVLIYAEMRHAEGNEARGAVASDLMRRLALDQRLVLPAQVIGELVNVLEQKVGRSRAEAAEAARRWHELGRLAPSDEVAVVQALELTGRHGLKIWDALVVAAAATAGSIVLLTEDLHDGFVWRGMTVANPFAAEPHPLLASLLA